MRAATASASAGLRGPWFEPLDTAPLYGIGAVADGRLQKYCGDENGWPSSHEPTARPSCSMRLPATLLGNATRPINVTASGYATPVTSVKAANTIRAGRS